MHAHICFALSPACLRDAASVEATALRRLAHARGRELRTVCRLAQAVLRQRSDVETFLVAALQQACAVLECKCRIHEMRAKTLQQATHGHPMLGPHVRVHGR